MNEKLVREVILSFREVQRKTHYFLAEEASRREITVMQLLALSTIKKEPHLTLGELAERMKLGKSTVSGIVDRLVKAGFLSRTRNDQNRRTLNLKLTEMGDQKATETYDLFFKRLDPILEIDEKELQNMLKTHHKILTILEREGANK
ncbi:MarR family winged helix-turn-helix transcriptional regulator [Listeria sp. PSOL-1]|uniref:MarR family winged helix-turn-helix transcriptional regulator n=1 Tax=Listeria sp. PSOL-1 TaxID=1844999 RepID=UPI0013D2E4DF|nr:MarR family transcriptional regulator [Listeria sp. PSOL-1]